jgi:hypothetical protein
MHCGHEGRGPKCVHRKGSCILDPETVDSRHDVRQRVVRSGGRLEAIPQLCYQT